MKKIKFGMILALLLLFSSPYIGVAQDDHGGHGSTGDDCTPDQMVHIGSEEFTNEFNVTEVKVDKGSCVMIHFRNNAETEHDFTLENDHGEEWVHLHLDNSTDHSHGMPGMAAIILQMPDEDITLDYYCSVEGHKDTMNGELIVGEGSADEAGFLPFQFSSVLAGLLALAIALPIITKRRK